MRGLRKSARQAPGWPGDGGVLERLAEAEVEAERSRAEAGRLRRALVDAEVDLQRSGASAASMQEQLRARPRCLSACSPDVVGVQHQSEAAAGVRWGRLGWSGCPQLPAWLQFRSVHLCGDHA